MRLLYLKMQAMQQDKKPDQTRSLPGKIRLRKRPYRYYPNRLPTCRRSGRPKRGRPEPKLSVPSVKDIPAADYSAGKPEPARPVGQEAPPAHPAQNLKTAELTHEEVEDFMKRYSSAYSKGDLNVFMSLFSKSVVENNRLHYNAVREAYRETFSEKISFYRVNNMTIMLNGPYAQLYQGTMI